MNRVIIAPPGGGPKGAAESKAADAGTVRLVRLPNGVRVLVKRVPNLPLVNIQAYVLGGSSCDGEKLAGRSALLAEMLDKGTQGGATAAEIAQYFDSIGGVLSFNSGRFTLSGAATCLKEDFPKAAGLFADSFLHPAIPQDQFEKAQALLLAEIENRSADPHAEITELFFDSLPATSPYHVQSRGQGGDGQGPDRGRSEEVPCRMHAAGRHGRHRLRRHSTGGCHRPGQAAFRRPCGGRSKAGGDDCAAIAMPFPSRRP